MKYILLVFIMSVCGCTNEYKKDWSKGKHFILTGFSTESFKKGVHVGNMGGGRTYHSVELNMEYDADSITVHYYDPVNIEYSFVKQHDSTWKLIKQ